MAPDDSPGTVVFRIPGRDSNGFDRAGNFHAAYQRGRGIRCFYFPSTSARPATGTARRVWLFLIWAIVLLGLGLLEGYAAPYLVFREFLSFVIVFSMLLLGRRDQVWKQLKKPIVIIFYLTLVVIILTLHAPAAVMTGEGYVVGKSLQAPRNLDTVAFACREAIDLGPLLFAWGMSCHAKRYLAAADDRRDRCLHRG